MGHSLQARFTVRLGRWLRCRWCPRIHQGLVFSNRDARTLLDKLVALLFSIVGAWNRQVLLIADAYYASAKGTCCGRSVLGNRTSDAYRAGVRRKLRAYHVHVQLGCIAQGLLQHLAINFKAEVWRCFRSWLRTMNPDMPPSELIVVSALRSNLTLFITVPALDPSIKKIMGQYCRHDPPSDAYLRAA